MQYRWLTTQLGRLLIVADAGAVTRVQFMTSRSSTAAEPDWHSGGELVDEALAQLEAYLSGELVQFRLRLRPRGTAFQARVWSQLRKIPYGSTATYGELAARIGQPGAARAVGAAARANPIAIIVPCHRLLGKGGSLVGFSAGLQRKAALLELERAHRR